MLLELDRARRGCLAFEALAAQSLNGRVDLSVALDTLDALTKYIDLLETT